MSEKITPIHSGIDNLMKAAKGSIVQAAIYQVYVTLEGKYFFTADSPGCMSQPPFPLIFPVAYSEEFEPSVTGLQPKLSSIRRHNNLMFFGGGVRCEEVKPPSWWGKRDEGMLCVQ